MAPGTLKSICALTIVTTVTIFGGVAAAEPSPQDHLGLNLSLTAESYQTPFVRTLLFGPTLDLVYRHEFNPYLDARVGLAFEALTGAASGILPTDMLGQVGPRQIFRLREALVDAHTAGRGLGLKTGAFNQRVWGNPLLGGDLVFLGALAEVRHEAEGGELSLKLAGAVPPTSFSLLETASQGQTPTFAAAQLGAMTGTRKDTFAEATAGVFQFNQLTTAQARQSLFWGNTVVGNTRSARFYLPYRGVEGGLKGGVTLAPRWQLVAASNLVLNTAAPGGANRGYLAQVGLKTEVDVGTIGAHVGYFDDQSDSSPAVFSDGFLNSKNHRGVFVDLRFDATTYSVFVRGLSAAALVPQPYGGRDVGALIGIEVRHDLLK